MPGRSMIACIGLVARVTQNKKSIRKSEINLEIRNQFGNQKSIWKSEINLEIRNQSLEIRNQVRNHGDLKSRMLFSKVSYPSGLLACSRAITRAACIVNTLRVLIARYVFTRVSRVHYLSSSNSPVKVRIGKHICKGRGLYY